MNEVVAILEIMASISSTLALDEILAQIVEKTAQIMGADGCAISLWNAQENTIVVMADYIAPEARIEDDVQDVGRAYSLDQFPATARVLQEQIPLVVYADDSASDTFEKGLLKLLQWDGVLMLPMVYKGRPIGLMEIYTDDQQRYRFNQDNIRLCQALAIQAAVAIENARLFTELAAQQAALHQLTLRLINAQEEERRHVSRELHDELGQALTALKISLDLVNQGLPDKTPLKLRNHLAEARQLAFYTQETVRTLALHLRPPLLDDLGLIPTLRWEIDRHRQRTQQIVQFEAGLDDVFLSPELEITIYRIVTEALTNVARHAQAQHLRVFLQVQQQQLLVGIEDDGHGFEAEEWFSSPAERQSLGLVSMQERVQLLAGQFQIISKPGLGTKILAQFPLK
jgi:signal transduction histidine kinase